MNDKRARQFLDTNVLVYAHDTSAGVKHEKAKALVGRLWETRDGCLSVQVLQEFYVTVTRKVTKPIDSAEAAQIISDLATWRIHEPGAQDVLGAVEIHRRYGISFWDAMIIQSASRLGCNLVWSEDLNPGQIYDQVTVRTPFAE